MDAGQIATLAIVAGLAVEKILIHLDCYNGVRRLHCNLSSCCDVDVDRRSGRSSPPESPRSRPPHPFTVPHPAEMLARSGAYAGEAGLGHGRAMAYRVTRSFSEPTLKTDHFKKDAHK